MKKSCILLGLSLLLFSCQEQKNYPFHYEILEGEAIIYRLDEAYQSTLKVLEIPETIDGFPVTQIRSHAFSESVIEEIVWPETDALITIGQAAFANCDFLKSVEIPSTVTAIAQEAFAQCKALEHVDFSRARSLEFIGSAAFLEDSGLGYLEFPPSLRIVGDEAFYDCTSLIEAHFYSQLESIGMNAFCNDIHLTVYFHGLEELPEGFSTDWNSSDSETDDGTWQIPYEFAS